MKNKNWFERHFIDRNLIKKDEKKITYLQFFGVAIMCASIVYMTSFLLPSGIIDFFPKLKLEEKPIGDVIAIAFFVTMLGLSMAVPSLLEGNEGLSTMRIVVFMMVNVICFLLIKIGWDAKSLTDIGLDQYWMGIIAFIFGAKATQSFFENGMNLNKKEEEKTTASENATQVNQKEEKQSVENLIPATPKIIEEFIKEKGIEWVNSFPNVTGFAIRNKIADGKETNECALIFKVAKKEIELAFGKIPKLIKYHSDDGASYKIITDVIEEDIPISNIVAINKSPFPLGNSVSREHSAGTGSIGLLVKKVGDDSSKFIVSCYHVLCAPELKLGNKTFVNYNDSASIRAASFVDNGTNNIGFTIEGKMDSVSDFAVAKIREGYEVSNIIFDLNLSPKGLSQVISTDKGKSVKMCGRTSGKKMGKIKSHFAPQTIKYTDSSQFFNRLIEIDPIAQPGDSGTAVLDSNDCVIGLLIGSSSVSSYVIPINDFINTNKYYLQT
jgi:hypothetical protein